MDPISIAGIVESSLGLALQFGSAAKSLSTIAGKYKNAKLTVQSLAQNLDILQLTWTQIGYWFETYAEDESLRDNDLVKRLKDFLDSGTLVMEALERDMLAYDVENLNFTQRSKLIWNENTLQGHQTRIRDQTLSMNLFLQVVKLPTPKARAKLLRKSEDQFRKSDESAYSIDSITPSQLSLSTSHRHSLAYSSQGSLEYHPLSFENKLFMSKAYMRHSKKMMIKKIFRVGTQSKEKMRESSQPMPNWEAIRNELDADSLLLSSEEVSIEEDETIRPHKDGTHSPQNFDTSSIPAQKSTETLIQACEQGNSVQVMKLLVGGLDVHARFTGIMYSGYTAIHVAALYGHTNVVETLLNHAANIDEEDVMGKRRPLHFAAGSRRISMARFLIRHGAQIDAKARNAVQPIHEASWSGSIEILDALIKAGAAVDCSDTRGYQPLHWATMTPNQPDVIRYLSKKKADLEAEISDGFRAVHLACRTDPTNLRTILALGAKTDYDDGTDSALITAICSESKLAVEILLKHGVDPNRQASDGSTALHALATLHFKTPSEPSNDREICQLLLDHGANVHIKDENGNQVLHYLASHGSTSMVDSVAMEELAELVLDRGADVDATDNQGRGPLLLAICCGDRQLSRLLIRSGSRVLMDIKMVRADVQVRMTPNAQMPRYIVNNYCGDRVFGHQLRFSLPSLELLTDDDGFFTESAMNAVCEKFRIYLE